VIITLARRLLMLTCLVGILVLMVLWLMAENQNASNQNDKPVRGDLKIYAKSEQESGKFLVTLKGTGYNAQVMSESGTKDKLSGYAVAGDFSESLVSNISEYLETNNYKVTVNPSKVKKGKYRCQVGKVYSNKAQAQSMVKKIEDDLLVVFNVEPVYKPVPAKLHFLLIEDIDEETRYELEDKFKDKATDFKFIEYPEEGEV